MTGGLIILTVLALASALALGRVFIEGRQFTRDPRNPFRRWCRQCGQCQEQYRRVGDCHNSWWEDVGTACNPECACHKYQEYRR